METKKLSPAVLHLDLTSAFHHLVRELVLGVAYEADINRIIQDLHEAGHPLEARSHGQRLIEGCWVLWMWPEDPTIAQGGARWMPTTGAYQNKTWDQTWVATS